MIHEQIFAVITRGLVFVKARPGFEQGLPARLADRADGMCVEVRSGRDNLHLHTAMQRLDQGAAAQVIGNEVGIGDANGLAGRGDGNEQHQPRAIGAFAGGAFEDLAGVIARGFELWKVRVAVQ